MKKTLLSLIALLFWASIQAQTCTPNYTFNNSGTNTFIVSDPNGAIGGTITVANGIQLTNGNGTVGVQDNRECRAYKSITALNDTKFTVECTVNLTAGSGPSHSPIALSAGTADFAFNVGSNCSNDPNVGCPPYTPTNQSAIIVYIQGGSTNIMTGGTTIVAYTKLGNAAHSLASNAITIPSSAVGNFKIRLERISATQGRLSYVNASTNAIVSSECFAIPSGITGLNTLQAGANTAGSYDRSLGGTFNNYNIYDNCLVTTLPTPTANPVSIVCGNTASLTASTTISSPTFSWYNVASGGTALATGATYTTPVLTTSATYYVSYADACGQVSNRKAILVTVTPNIFVAPITGSSDVCKGQIIELECATPGGVWSSSDPLKATVKQTGVVKGIAVGTVTISYTVTSGVCTNTVTKDINIKDVLTFQILGPDPVCPNTSGNLYTVSTPVTGADYTWNIQDAPNVGVNFPVNGSVNTTLTIPNAVTNNQFTLRCQGLNACGASQMITKLIHVSTAVPPNPNVDCSGTNCATLFVTNNAGYNIEWSVGGVVQSTATTFARPAATAVLCTYTDPVSGCKKSTWYSPAVVCTYASRTSSKVEIDNELQVYPNPNTGDFTFITKGYSGKALVINTLGQVVEEITVGSLNTIYEVSMKNQAKGTYLLRLVGGDTEHTSTIVVQ